MDSELETIFSVVTVVRNDLSGLLKTRASLVDQSICDWRHIIIDGSSTDGSELFGEHVNSDPKTFFLSEEDDGIYHAMEKGWKSAEAGSFVVFLNAGDVFTSPDSLRIAKDRIESSPKILNWACSTHEEIMPDGSNWVCKLVSEPTLANQLYAYGYRSQQGVLMKKEFLRLLNLMFTFFIYVLTFSLFEYSWLMLLKLLSKCFIKKWCMRLWYTRNRMRSFL